MTTEIGDSHRLLVDQLEGREEEVPPAGFEPAISTLKGWCPRPLDDGGKRAHRAVRAKSLQVYAFLALDVKCCRHQFLSEGITRDRSESQAQIDTVVPCMLVQHVVETIY